MLRVLIAEDNEVVRCSLVKLLNCEPDITVVAVASDGCEVIDQLRKGIVADVVVADLSMPRMNGIELTQLLTQQFPAIKVIILTMHSGPAYIDRAHQAGAKAYVLKQAGLGELFLTIRRVAKAGKILQPESDGD